MKRLLAIASIALLSSLFTTTNTALAGDYKIGVLAKRGVAKAMKK